MAVIKIKTGASNVANTGAPTGLAAGELAYSFSANSGGKALVIGTGVSGTNEIIGGSAFFDTIGKIGTGFNVLATQPTISSPTLSGTVSITGAAVFSYANGISFKDANNNPDPAYTIKANSGTTDTLSTLFLPYTGTSTEAENILATIGGVAQTFGSTKTWNGAVIGATYGGTGVNNGSNTITLGGNFVTAAAFATAGVFATTLTATAATNVTLPTTGTLATLAGSESFTNKTGFNGLVITANNGIITTGTWNGTAIGATYGGTGQSIYAVGDLLYASTTTALSKLAAVATGNVLLSGGTTTAPAWGQVSLTAAVTGILPLANGGTGVTLAATGPGFLRQASANATVTVSAIVAADLPGSFSGFATPAASIGLIAIAGGAYTAMRSDGAPALSQAIAPTWTGNHIHQKATSATALTAADNAIALTTTLAATASATSNSPFISLQTNVWESGANASKSFNIQNQNITAGASTYQLAIATGAATVFTLNQSGNASFAGTVSSNTVLLDTISGANALSNKTSYNGLVITANTGAITFGTWNAGAVTSSGAISGTTLTGTSLVLGSGTIASGTITVTGAISASSTITAGTGLIVTTGGLTITAGGLALGTNTVTGTAIFTGGPSFTTACPTSSITPTSDTHIANKLYVDTVALGLHVHPPADVISTAGNLSYNLTANTSSAVTSATALTIALPDASNISFAGTSLTLLIDGISGTGAGTVNGTPTGNLVIGSRIVITGDTDATQQCTAGIYYIRVFTATSLILERTSDANVSSELNGGDFIFVKYGSAYADTGFVQTQSPGRTTSGVSSGTVNGDNFGTPSTGTTNTGPYRASFVQFSQTGVITAGNGLTKSGTTLTVVATDSSITVASSGISVGTIDGGNF